MPPPSKPKTTQHAYNYDNNVAHGAPTMPADDDDNYTYYGGGGCFGHTSTVLASNNGQIKETLVTELKAGDKIVVADGDTATIRCMVRIAEAADKSLISFPSGLTITEKHPIRLNGNWILPKDVEGASKIENTTGYVYCFVLDRCHVALVNGIECVTWGHNLKEEVVAHEYYGTEKVLEDLS